MPTTAQFTPTEARIYALLEDGYPHTRKEIFERCFEDDLANPAKTVGNKISKMRRKLRGSGEDIAIFIMTRIVSYRRVMLIGKAKDDDAIEREAYEASLVGEAD